MFSNKETSQTFKISFSAVSTNFWAIETVLETARCPLLADDSETQKSKQNRSFSAPPRCAPRAHPASARAIDLSTFPDFESLLLLLLLLLLTSTPTALPGRADATWASPSMFYVGKTSKKIFRNIEIFENCNFCLGSFSSVSTNFSILSSLSGRIRSHLDPEAQNFRSID